MTTTTAPFTLSDFNKIAQIVEAAQGNQRVAFLLEDGRIVQGTARSLGDENGYFQMGTEDIRTLHLRITTETGLERFELVSDLTEQLGSTFFTNVS